MERMRIVTDNTKVNENLLNRVKELEEENKKLNEINESQNEEIQRFKDNAMQDMREITELEIENKKLKEELSKYKKQYEHSMGEDDELIYEEGLYD